MRKRGLQLLRFLLLGVGTAVLIACVIALADPEGRLTCSGATFPQPTGVVSIEGPGYRIDALLRGLDNDPLTLTPPLGNSRGFTFIGGVSWSGSSSSHTRFRLEGGDRTVATPTLKPILPYGVEVLAARSCGWPLRCMESRATRTATGWSDSWGVRLSSPSPLPKTVFAATIPVRPLWPGLLWNTLLFSAAWAVVLSIPALVRNARAAIRRRRQGRCLHCGYDLRGLPSPVCPECGRTADIE